MPLDNKDIMGLVRFCNLTPEWQAEAKRILGNEAKNAFYLAPYSGQTPQETLLLYMCDKPQTTWRHL